MAGLESTTAVWHSEMAVRDLAELFRSAAEDAAPKGRLARMAAATNARSAERGLLKNVPRFGDMENKLAFFTPQSDSAFAQFDEPHDFSVGASIPHKSGFPLVVHMYVSDEGSERKVELVCPYIAKLGYTSANRKKAQQCLALVRAALTSSDPSARPA